LYQNCSVIHFKIDWDRRKIQSVIVTNIVGVIRKIGRGKQNQSMHSMVGEEREVRQEGCQEWMR